MLLWKNLRNYYSLDSASKMMPNTYILSNNEDVTRLKKEHNENNLYIMKKNIQRQEGLKITRKLTEILNGKKQGYVIVQELLQDPYLIDGRKINMRFYILVKCVNNIVSCYVHKAGFMYYTKVPFVKNSDNWDHNITTGYIDRKVYETNPLTHDDFRKYLDNNGENNILVFNKIYGLIKKVMIALKTNICNKNNTVPYTSFQLFGADIALNDKLEPNLMEINKGPDMGSKDKRDGELKYGVLVDVFKTIKIIPDLDNNSNFIKLF